jgi:hypothetical protein
MEFVSYGQVLTPSAKRKRIYARRYFHAEGVLLESPEGHRINHLTGQEN